MGQITITRNSDFVFKVKISDTRKQFRVIVFPYRRNNDNLELGILLLRNSENSENSKLSLWPSEHESEKENMFETKLPRGALLTLVHRIRFSDPIITQIQRR